ncbi:MAG: hypothetical protein J7K69_01220 [Thermotogae bacterium]|nr:hypothetical protein [Thermotogota bacterium]
MKQGKVKVYKMVPFTIQLGTKSKSQKENLLSE